MGAQQKPEAVSGSSRDNGGEVRRTPGYRMGWLEGKLATDKVHRERDQQSAEQRQAELERIQRELFRLRAEVHLSQESATGVEKLAKELEQSQAAWVRECQHLAGLMRAQAERQDRSDQLWGVEGQQFASVVEEVRQLVARQQHEAEKALFQQQALEAQRQRGLEALQELELCKDQLLLLAERTQGGLDQIGSLGASVDRALQGHSIQAARLAAQSERIEQGLGSLEAREAGMVARVREGQDALRETTALLVTVQAAVTAEVERREAWRADWLAERGRVATELEGAQELVSDLLGQVRAQAAEQARWQADNRDWQQRLDGLTTGLTQDREALQVLRGQLESDQTTSQGLLQQAQALAKDAGGQLAASKVQAEATEVLRGTLARQAQELDRLHLGVQADQAAWQQERTVLTGEIARWQGLAADLDKRCDQYGQALQAAQEAEREARAEVFSSQATQRALLAEREALALREAEQLTRMAEWQALLQEASLQGEAREQLLHEQTGWLEKARVREGELRDELASARALLLQERDALRLLTEERAKWQTLAETQAVECQRHAEALSALQQERKGWTVVLHKAEQQHKAASDVQENLRRELKEAGITNRELRLASQEMRQQVEQLRNSQQQNREELLAVRQDVRGLGKELEDLGGFAEDLESALGQQARRAEVDGLTMQLRELSGRLDGHGGELHGLRQVVELVLRSVPAPQAVVPDAGGNGAAEKRRPWFATRA